MVSLTWLVGFRDKPVDYRADPIGVVRERSLSGAVRVNQTNLVFGARPIDVDEDERLRVCRIALRRMLLKGRCLI